MKSYYITKDGHKWDLFTKKIRNSFATLSGDHVYSLHIEDDKLLSLNINCKKIKNIIIKSSDLGVLTLFLNEDTDFLLDTPNLEYATFIGKGKIYDFSVFPKIKTLTIEGIKDSKRCFVFPKTLIILYLNRRLFHFYEDLSSDIDFNGLRLIYQKEALNNLKKVMKLKTIYG